MWKVKSLAAAALAFCVTAAGQPAAPSDSVVQQRVAACNAVTDSSRPKRREIDACRALENDGRLSLVEQDTIIAYRRYQEETKRQEARIKSSPRGVSRGH
ncbi:MAG TPA: hypothetical protein VFO94_18685 [Gammaproteobacteria bacterium]|nr:hypothetical protein [Gammaproteobacteria bacterium]